MSNALGNLANRIGWDEYPCIEWPGRKHVEGYGVCKDDTLAHRMVFQFHYGYLPVEPMVVDHLCRNRLCIQPVHLQETSRAENTRLGSTRREFPEICPKGHSNWKVRKNGYRRCWTCHLESERGRKQRAA